jgi:hypothetical protein
MKVSDIDPSRIKLPPRGSSTIFTGSMEFHGFVISKIELKRFVERVDEELGEYSLLTVEVHTNRGGIMMKFDEGFRGYDALETAARMLKLYTGLSSLINRAIIELEQTFQ